VVSHAAAPSPNNVTAHSSSSSAALAPEIITTDSNGDLCSSPLEVIGHEEVPATPTTPNEQHSLVGFGINS
jgi:hypothetical protein